MIMQTQNENTTPQHVINYYSTMLVSMSCVPKGLPGNLCTL